MVQGQPWFKINTGFRVRRCYSSFRYLESRFISNFVVDILTQWHTENWPDIEDHLCLFFFQNENQTVITVIVFMLSTAQCMNTYWEIGNRLSAVRCPSCRQQVSLSLLPAMLKCTEN